MLIMNDKKIKAIGDVRKFNIDKWAEEFFFKNKLGTNIKELGLKESDFTDEYKHKIDSELDFSISEDQIKDNKISYYRYESTTGNEAQRPFCRSLMNQTNSGILFSQPDITAMNNDPGKANRAGGGGYSVFKFRGGDNCVHKWVKYVYDTEEKQLVKGRVQPRQVSLR